MISKEQQELMDKLNIIKINENEYLLPLELVQEELIADCIKLCSIDNRITLLVEPKNVKKIKDVKTMLEQINICFMCDNISQAPMKLMEEYHVKYVIVGNSENKSVKKMSIDKYRMIYNTIYDIVKDIIPLRLKEKERFKEVYKRLAERMEYDSEALEDNEYGMRNNHKSRNLENAVLLNKTLCLGFAETLKQTLSLVNIKSIICYSIRGDKGFAHAYNIVRIDNRWYNTDLTLDYINIRQRKRPKYCLKSDKDFLDCSPENIPYHTPKDSNVPKCKKSLRIFTEYKRNRKNKIRTLLKKLKKGKNENNFVKHIKLASRDALKSRIKNNQEPKQIERTTISRTTINNLLEK